LRKCTSEILERAHVDYGEVTSRLEAVPDDDVSALLTPSLRA
jgi:hypothetical protein